MDKVELRVKSIDRETRKAINQLAKQSKFTTAQYLDLTFSGIKPQSSSNYQWHISGIDPNIKERIKTQAALKKMSIGQYLKYLIDKEEPKENEVIKDAINHLDSARSLLDDFS